MKLIYSIFLCLFTLVACSQIKNGIINYKVTFDQNDMKDFDIYKEAETATDRLEYTLKFDREVSVFNLEPTMNEDLAYKYASAFAGKNTIYQILKDSTIQHNNSESNGIKKNEFLIKDTINTGWVLHNETKLIDNYLCYKATTTYQIKNTAKTATFPVTAWYCPKIPYGFGPKGYGLLPGLILELQERNILFGAYQVTFDIPELKIKEPTEGKIISKSEFSKISKEKSEKYRNNH